MDAARAGFVPAERVAAHLELAQAWSNRPGEGGLGQQLQEADAPLPCANGLVCALRGRGQWCLGNTVPLRLLRQRFGTMARLY
jgi:hypothetical protein